MNNIYNLDGTPINIVRHTVVRADVECSIYPIHINHTKSLDELFDADPFFSRMDICYTGYEQRINKVVCRCDGWFALELSIRLPEIEAKVNEVFEKFLNGANGYFAVQA